MITAEKAKKEHENLKEVWSRESKLTQKILIAILEKLEKPKPKKKPTKYNKFLSREMKKGLSFNEAVEKWRKRK